MRSITKPNDDVEVVYLDCVSIVRDKVLKDKLSLAKSKVVAATDEFERKVTKGKLFTIKHDKKNIGDVTSKELEDVYNLRMVKIGTPGRKIYDKIKISAPHGICPLCAQRLVTTVDHYLPKSIYSKLSVSPINLVPSCSDCNSVKFDSFPQEDFQEFFHPYFDNIENDPWLFAVIQHSTPPVVEFTVKTPKNWNLLLGKRVNYHFDVLELNSLYKVHAATELTTLRNKLSELADPTTIRVFLLDIAKMKCDYSINSWQAAFYKALAEDNWFCNGGFKF